VVSARSASRVSSSPRHTRWVSVADAVFAAAVDRLEAAGCVAATKEAAEFLAAAPDEHTLEAWLLRRDRGEPSAWITGTLLFCGRPLHVAPGVYVPRVQSEELARRAATLLPDNGRAVDLCTGAGAVAAHLIAQAPAAVVIGIDIDVRAAACARRNGVPSAVADLAEPLCRHEEFDVVTAVAPYVPTGELRLLRADVQRYEPRLALDGGADGLDLVRRVIAAAERLLRPGGWLLTEIGGHQDETLAPILATTAFDLVTPWWDEDGDLRGIAAQAAGSGS
jgi:release factor glutamine methyltransferase